MVIAIDFDGTCVTNDYPYIGKGIGVNNCIKEDCREGPSDYSIYNEG